MMTIPQEFRLQEDVHSIWIRILNASSSKVATER